MEKTALENKTLAMIVRDEENNPAGGINRNLPILLPHVQEAVVVDTGSKDKTSNILKRLQRKFPHLRTYERQFDGFSSSRNYSLSQVRTKMALVLDADELLTAEDFEILVDFVKKNPYNRYNFYFDCLYPSGTVEKSCMPGVWATRLFDTIGSEFKTSNPHRDYFENIGYEEEILKAPFAPVNIKHFLPPHEIIKMLDWYNGNTFLTEQPLKNAKEYGWKEFNGWRRLFGNGENNIDYDSFRR